MTTIQLRRGTSAQWTASNPVLASGEPGIDTTAQLLKIGDGVTAWASLPRPDVFTTTQRDALTGASLWRGRRIFNDTTGAVEVYYGAVTGWRPPWNTAWGLVTPIVTRSNSVITGGAAFVQIIASAAFTMLANRLLDIRYPCAISGGALTTTTMQIRRNIGGSIVGSFFLRREAASSPQSETVTLAETPPAGSTSYEVGFIAGATSAWTDHGSLISTSQLVIVDRGPNGNAPAS